MTSQQQSSQVSHGDVKQVLSGDSVTILEFTKIGGRPLEHTLIFSNIVAPKLARKTPETKDQAFAWEAREFLRKKLVGKEVRFAYEVIKDKKYGVIYLGKDANVENVTDSLVSEGLVDVRRAGVKSAEHQKLCELEESAKSASKGKFSPQAPLHVRDIHWSVENPSNLMDSLNRKPIKAIVEHVRDGSTMRVLLLPDELKPGYHYITVMLSGIRCPALPPEKDHFEDDSRKAPEPYAEEAKYFTERKLLQRDVDVLLESVSNQNFRGTILNPVSKNNIAELLLSEGYAKCIDWSLQCVTSGLGKLRAAEKRAKEKRLRIWENYVPSGPVIDEKEKEFEGKVVEVINADALKVKLSDGSVKKIFLASIRPPRLEPNQEVAKDKVLRPLYDIPYMFEAREFLRKKLIGKVVNVTIDYKQPANDNYPEKICCTVKISGVNVAEALISKGLAKAVRYRADNDQRSSHYDELLAAENKAEKSGKGMHSKKDGTIHRINDLSGDPQKSRQFKTFLQRADKIDAVVDFVVSGSRLRLYVPRENCLMTFLLEGITCLRASRNTKGGVQPGEPYGDDALAFTKDLCLQREVKIKVDDSDKVGNFIGWLWIDNINLSEALVREGYAEVYHQSASRNPYYKELVAAQEEAQKNNLKMWKDYEVKEHEPKETLERVVKYKTVMVTEVKPDLKFFAQHVEDGPKLEEMMQQMRQDFSKNPPLPGAYSPKRRELCAALYDMDHLWYRAKVEKIQGSQVTVHFMDFGNSEVTNVSNLASLPSAYQSLPATAHEYGLAFIKLRPEDPEMSEEARNQFVAKTDNKNLLLNVEYTPGPAPFVTLLTSEEKRDVGKELIEEGLVLVDDVKREKKNEKILKDFYAAQEAAKKARLNIWQYGDIREDDAKEFG